MHFYSKTTNGFYVESIHGARRCMSDAKVPVEMPNPDCLIPLDAVGVTDAQHTALLQSQSLGGKISVDASGAVVSMMPAPPTLAESTAGIISTIRAARQPVLSILDGMQASSLVKADMVTANAIELAKQGLRDITKMNLTSFTTPDQIRTAVVAQYQSIAAALPASARTAFAGSTL